MASLTQGAWVWVNSRRWWWTGRPGMLWFMGSRRVRHDWAIELNWMTNCNCFTEMPLFFMDSFLCYWILRLVLYFSASFLKTSHFCLHASKIFSLPSVFSCLSMMCLSMVFFVLILFGLIGLISFGIEWLDLLVVQRLSSVFSSTKVQRHQFFGT